jgi:hypothetical protein
MAEEVVMARTVGSKNVKPQLDPLLAALIARLPRSNRQWPTKDRAAWLGMMEMAFDVVYGGERGGSMTDIPVIIHPKANGAEPVKPADEPAFYIDREGYARMAGGERIDAHQVDGLLFDMRGEGDLGAIVWADGSKGVLGKVLDIRPA